MDNVIKQHAVLEFLRKAPKKGIETSGFWVVDTWKVTSIVNGETVNITVSLTNYEAVIDMTAQLNIKQMTLDFWEIVRSE